MTAPRVVVAEGGSTGHPGPEATFVEALLRLDPECEITRMRSTDDPRASVRTIGAVLDRVHAEVLVVCGGHGSLAPALAARLHAVPVVILQPAGETAAGGRLAVRMAGHAVRGTAGRRLARFVLTGIVAERRRAASVSAEKTYLAS